MTHNASQNRLLICCLMYAGAIPFVLFTFFLLEPHLWPFSSYLQVYAIGYFGYYSAVILSFLAGIHWGLALIDSRFPQRTLLLLSNAVALMAWVAMAFPAKQSSLFLLGFIVQLIVDFVLMRRELLPRWYFNLRTQVTVVVILCLLPGFIDTIKSAFF